MQTISPLQCHKTSISLRLSSYRRVRAAQKILARNGIDFSNQEIYRRLFKMFLKHWRGRRTKSTTLRRYNADGYVYEVYPLYVDQVLYSALWQRAVHSGESVSRMLDFAIRNYMGRLLEGLLRSPRRGNFRSQRNAPYWEARHARRIAPYADFFINYECKTLGNDGSTFNYVQNTRIIYKKGLSPEQIMHFLYTSA